MSVKEMMPIIFGVLKDWRVIVTVVAMILVITFVKYITNLKHKPKKAKAKKGAAKAAAAPASEEGMSDVQEPKSDISENDV